MVATKLLMKKIYTLKFHTHTKKKERKRTKVHNNNNYFKVPTTPYPYNALPHKAETTQKKKIKNSM